jgi:hypothetical protein
MAEEEEDIETEAGDFDVEILVDSPTKPMGFVNSGYVNPGSAADPPNV